VEVIGIEVTVGTAEVEVTAADEVGEPIMLEVVWVIGSAIEVEVGPTADAGTDVTVPQPASKIANKSITNAINLKNLFIIFFPY
jgi:hypothetical protein